LLHCISSSPGLRVGNIDPLLFADRLPRSLHRNMSGNRQPIVLFWVNQEYQAFCPNGVRNRRHHAEIPIGHRLSSIGPMGVGSIDGLSPADRLPPQKTFAIEYRLMLFYCELGQLLENCFSFVSFTVVVNPLWRGGISP